MIFTISLVTAVVIEYIGVGRQRVHKQEVLRSLLHEAIRLGKDEDVAFRSIDKESAQSRSIVASRMVILAVHATIERGIHE